MKLPIKKKYFDMIKSGSKNIEYRDAHITFVCEETGETLRKEVYDVGMVKRNRIPDYAKEIIEDENVLWILLK